MCVLPGELLVLVNAVTVLDLAFTPQRLKLVTGLLAVVLEKDPAVQGAIQAHIEWLTCCVALAVSHETRIEIARMLS